MSKNISYLFSSQFLYTFFFSMSKRQKLSDPDDQFEGLPDEVILKILGYLEGTKGLIYCGHLSRRIRKISQDETLWQKINLSSQSVPAGFLQMVLNNGCKYLCLRNSYLHGSLKLNRPTQLRYLDSVFDHTNPTSDEVLEELLVSCTSLEKLSVNHLKYPLGNRISQENWNSLEVLNFERGLDLRSLRLVVKSCVELKELNLARIDLSEVAINFLVNNLTPKIKKLNLSWIGKKSARMKDEQIKTLVERCNKITSLNLQRSEITNKSITSIVENLQFSLEELDISCCGISYNKLLELKLMPKLKVLNCDGKDLEMVMNLKKDLPNLISQYMEIAENRSLDAGIWGIKAKNFPL